MAAKTEFPVASLAPDVFARLFPEIAAFWARYENTNRSPRKWQPSRTGDLLAMSQASWTPSQAIPGAGKIRCQCWHTTP